MKSEIERRVDDVKNRREDIRDQLKSRLTSPSVPSSPASTRPSYLPPTSSRKLPSSSSADSSDKKSNEAKSKEPVTLKVVCKYRAELYFKMTRQTKFDKLFKAWSSRMDFNNTSNYSSTNSRSNSASEDGDEYDDLVPMNGKTDGGAAFVYTHNGRPIGEEMTVDDVGVEDGDTIVAVELVDLTEVTVRSVRVILTYVGRLTGDFRSAKSSQDEELVALPQQARLKKNWTSDPAEYALCLNLLYQFFPYSFYFQSQESG